MTKWILFKSMEKRNTSVLYQLNSAHQQHILSDRQYLRVIIYCLAFTAQQGITLWGQEENRSWISEVSDINRGNFLELLLLRSRDLPWLKTKLKNQLENHAQWTSPDIQKEFLSIKANVLFERIKVEVNGRKYFWVIIDDIIKVEQVSICLRYVFEGGNQKKLLQVSSRQLQHLGRISTISSKENLERWSWTLPTLLQNVLMVLQT